jgi:hypothetical protein
VLPWGEEKYETIETVIKVVVPQGNLPMDIRFEEKLAILVKLPVPQHVTDKRKRRITGIRPRQDPELLGKLRRLEAIADLRIHMHIRQLQNEHCTSLPGALNVPPDRSLT